MTENKMIELLWDIKGQVSNLSDLENSEIELKLLLQDILELLEGLVGATKLFGNNEQV